MNETRLNVRIEGIMADHVDNLIEQKLYNNQSEYVRDLIRRDIEFRKDPVADQIAQSILRSHEDILSGRIIESTGDYSKDKEIFAKKKKDEWA